MLILNLAPLETRRGSPVMFVQSCEVTLLSVGVLALTVRSLMANITRCFFWLGDRFEIALLVQSLLMIVAQVCHIIHNSRRCTQGEPMSVFSSLCYTSVYASVPS